MPTERFRFQSNYFKNFEMSGSVGYSTSDYHFSDLSEVVNGWTARTAERGSDGGRADKNQACFGECELVGRVLRQ